MKEFDRLTEDLAPEEQRRLRRVHDLLISAGPPPALPRSLRRAPRPGRPWPTGRRPVVAALAAALALVAGSFALGYVIADDEVDFEHDFFVDMRGAAAAPEASGRIDVGKRDEAGNWPMVISVRGLRELPADGRYLLYLTRGGRPVAWCGSFRVHEGKTTSLLNAPYRFDRFDGWVVRADIPGRRLDTRPYLVSRDVGEV